MIEELLGEAETKMDHAVEHVQGEFGTVRTGRANPAILHRVMVDYYGTPTPLQQLASFSVPEPRLLVVAPYDKIVDAATSNRRSRRRIWVSTRPTTAP